MYEIVVRGDFSAAHRLDNYMGDCERLHGHNFIVEIGVICDKLNEAHIAIDFKKLKSIMRGILSELDHVYLNGIGFFEVTNPTSEKIAEYIYKRTAEKLDVPHCKVRFVSVYETPTSKATYFEV